MSWLEKPPGRGNIPGLVNSILSMRALLLLLPLGLVACAGAAPPPAAAPLAAPTHVVVDQQIITPTQDASARELLARGERALLDGDYEEARRALDTLLAAGPSPAMKPLVLFELGAAYEGLGQRERARDLYHEVADEFPHSPQARAALERAVWVHAYLEEWDKLGVTGEALLARPDAKPIDRMTAYGARALSRIEAGDDDHAMRDVQSGLDIVEALHFGTAGRLPPPVAMLRFALAEIRRVRSERITLQPVTDDFVARLSARCQLLLDAQSAYADAMRSEDTHWTTMSGYRVGAMYRQLHAELMAIPSDGRAKNDSDRQVFYAIMHVRYRALLDKGIEMLRRTLATADRTHDDSAWVARCKEAKAEMEKSLEEEKATMARFPFNEATTQRALEIMEQHYKEKQAKAAGHHAAAAGKATRAKGTGHDRHAAGGEEVVTHPKHAASSSGP